MYHSHSWRRSLRLTIIAASALFAGVACDDGSDSATDGSGGTSATSTVTTSGGGSGGSTSSTAQSSTTANSSTSGGGAPPECNVRPIDSCYTDTGTDEEQCYTLAELNDPCSGTHLLSVHAGQAGAGGEGGAGSGVVGDGGTEDCPSAEELFWGDAGERCGCFDVPACETPTVQRGAQCCYRVQRSCRLC